MLEAADETTWVWSWSRSRASSLRLQVGPFISISGTGTSEKKYFYSEFQSLPVIKTLLRPLGGMWWCVRCLRFKRWCHPDVYDRSHSCRVRTHNLECIYYVLTRFCFTKWFSLLGWSFKTLLLPTTCRSVYFNVSVKSSRTYGPSVAETNPFSLVARVDSCLVGVLCFHEWREHY